VKEKGGYAVYVYSEGMPETTGLLPRKSCATRVAETLTELPYFDTEQTYEILHKHVQMLACFGQIGQIYLKEIMIFC
jgi:hypothetical protein